MRLQSDPIVNGAGDQIVVPRLFSAPSDAGLIQISAYEMRETAGTAQPWRPGVRADGSCGAAGAGTYSGAAGARRYEYAPARVFAGGQQPSRELPPQCRPGIPPSRNPGT